LKNTVTSSIGCGVRRSHKAKAASTPTDSAKPAAVCALRQPQLGASMTV
jgi:hypothetical protein